MAILEVNGAASWMEDITDGVVIEKSSFYSVSLTDIAEADLYVNVFFYTIMQDYDSSYNVDTINASVCWSEVGWMDLPAHYEVNNGIASIVIEADDDYGIITAFQADFDSVPESTEIIGVEFGYLGNPCPTYYWSARTPTKITWSNKELEIIQRGKYLEISWDEAETNDDSTVTYFLYCGSDSNGVIWEGTETYVTIEVPEYGEELAYFICATAGNAQPVWSKTAYFTAKRKIHKTIRCYIDGEWQDCIVMYYDGYDWIESVVKYYDGTQWMECSF